MYSLILLCASRIDSLASQKSATLRNQIFGYLETKLPCTKQTISMRAKKLRNQQEELRIGAVLRRLKIAVDTVMPNALIAHEDECKRVIERREAFAIIGGPDNPEQLIKMPKKRFPWTETIQYVIVTDVGGEFCFEIVNPFIFGPQRISRRHDFYKTSIL